MSTVTVQHALDFNQITERSIHAIIEQHDGIQALARKLANVWDNTNVDDGHGELADTAHHSIEGGYYEVLAALVMLAADAGEWGE